MGGAYVAKYDRRAPRYKLTTTDNAQIRFASSRNKKIVHTKLFDISESGIAFLTPFRQAPRIGEIIKIEFAPPGSVQIACLGKVIRIEEPRQDSELSKTTNLAKVGV